MAKSAGEIYEDAMADGIDLVDDIRFRGIKTERAAKRLEKLLDKFEKAWLKQTARELNK